MGERETQGAWKYGMKILTLPLSKETRAGSPWSGVSTTSECGWTGSLQLSTAAGAASAALMAEVRPFLSLPFPSLPFVLCEIEQPVGENNKINSSKF